LLFPTQLFLQPELVADLGWHLDWIYWLGPLLGSVLAVGFYKFIKALEYETANPGQDFNDKEAEVFQVDEETANTAADVARPNVAIGRSEYIADGRGIYHSQETMATLVTATLILPVPLPPFPRSSKCLARKRPPHQDVDMMVPCLELLMMAVILTVLVIV
jgi:hypothetical protein